MKTKLSLFITISFLSFQIAYTQSTTKADYHADQLAFQSAISLEQGDPSLAFLLARWGYLYASKENTRIHSALFNAFYNNDLNNQKKFLWSEAFSGSENTSRLQVDISPNSKWMAASFKSDIQIWNLETGELKKTLSNTSSICTSLKFANNNKLTYTELGSVLKVYDVEKDQNIYTYRSEGPDVFVFNGALSADEKYLVVNDDKGMLHLIDFTTKKIIKTIKTGIVESDMLQFSPDGKFLSLRGKEAPLRIYNFPSLELFKSLKQSGHFSFSPDGKEFAYYHAKGHINVLNFAKNKLVKRIVTDQKPATSINYSADGKYILKATPNTKIEIWERSTGRLFQNLLGHEFQVSDAAFSPDGKYLFTTCFNKILKWHWSSINNRHAFLLEDILSHQVFFSRDEKRFAINNKQKEITIWDATRFEPISKIPKKANNFFNEARFSSDGKFVLIWNSDKTVQVWDLEKNSFSSSFSLFNPETHFRHLSFEDKNKLIFTHSYNKPGIIWNWSSGELVQEFDSLGKGILPSSVFTKNGKELITSQKSEYVLKFWDILTTKLIRKVKMPFDFVDQMQVSPDGSFLFFLSKKHKGIGLLDLNTHEITKMFYGQNQRAKYAFSSDSRFFLISGQKGNLPINRWNLTENRWEHASTFNDLELPDNRNLNFSPNGNWITLSGFRDKKVQFYHLTPDQILNQGKNLADFGYLSPEKITHFHLDNLFDWKEDNIETFIKNESVVQIESLAQFYEKKLPQYPKPQQNDYEKALRLYEACLEKSDDKKYFERKIKDLKYYWGNKF